jgi:hypothetical protein
MHLLSKLKHCIHSIHNLTIKLMDLVCGTSFLTSMNYKHNTSIVVQECVTQSKSHTHNTSGVSYSDVK